MPSKVMITEQERELLMPYDSFTQMLYTWGIKFGCDFWGVMNNNLYEIGMALNPDTQFPEDKVKDSLKQLEETELISYIGSNNQILIVNDYGKVNYIENMKTNHTRSGTTTKFQIPIKIAIKLGQLPPYFLELPSIPFHRKSEFIERYDNGTLEQLQYQKKIEGRMRTFNFRDTLMMRDMYFENIERQNDLNDSKKEVDNGHPF